MEIVFLTTKHFQIPGYWAYRHIHTADTMHHWVFLGDMRQACLKNKILQLQWPTTETKNLTAKTKYLTGKPKTSRQKQKPHGKTKDLLDLTAKP